MEWLGEVPEHWNARRLKTLVTEPLKYGANEAAELDDRDLPRFVRITDIDDSGALRDETFKSLPLEIAEPYLLHEGDVLLARSGATAGKSFIYSKAWGVACFAGYLIRARLDPSECLPEWLFYFCQTDGYWAYVLGSAIQATIQNVSAEKYANLVLPLPAPTEQSAIATFLDRETAKIDSLVAEQRRLIELLKEKRQAVISHAVTKGVNPNAKLKSSGIDWLGDVPEHWEVCSVRRIIDRIEQGWSPECYARPAEPEEWGVLKSGCVNRGVLNEEENKALPETLSPLPEYEVKAGDVLISRASGSPELVGSTAYVSAIRPRLMLSDKTFRIHLEPAIAKRFFVAAFNSRFLRDQIERAISGAEGLANNLPQSALLTFAICVPPVEEQEAIVQRLEEEIGKLNALTAAAERAISLLQERRTALISAAVTGKIDVRDVGSMEVT